MSAFYYVLGAVAKMNAALWRRRINFLPLNVMVIGLMVLLGFGTATDAVESMHNGSIPVAVSLAQIHADPQPAQYFNGFTTSLRSGLWSLAIDAGSVQDTEAGYFYWGTARRPGFRFSYTTGGGAKRRAIIAADDISSLSTALALLTAPGTPHGAPTT